MWGDFLLVALDQLINQAANVRYVSRGQHCAPLVVRTQQGATPGSCAQHSQSLEALLAHIPGLRVGLAATAQDAHAMLRAAVADDDPVILFESRALYQHKGMVALGGEREGVGGARVRRSGGDVAILSWGRTALLAGQAAERLAADGIEATVLDLRWLAPLDDAAIAARRRAHRARARGPRGERHRRLRRGDRGADRRDAVRLARRTGPAPRRARHADPARAGPAGGAAAVGGGDRARRDGARAGRLMGRPPAEEERQ